MRPAKQTNKQTIKQTICLLITRFNFKNILLSTTVSSQGMRMIGSEAMSVLCLSMAIIYTIQSYCYHKVLEMSNFCVRFSA